MTRSIPSVSVTYAHNGASNTSNELGMRAVQERAYERRREQFEMYTRISVKVLNDV